MALDAFAGVWDAKYPHVSRSWRVHRENLNTFFGYRRSRRRACAQRRGGQQAYPLSICFILNIP